MCVVILAALLPEARALAQALHLPARFAGGVERRGGGEGIAICLVGPGAKNLSRVADLNPRAIIMAGLAGGLSPELQVGDVVIPGLGHKLGALKDLGHRVFTGELATAAGIVATPEAKAALFRKTGALAVDMETQPAEALARTLNVPFLAVRAISDGAGDALDPAMLAFIDGEGRPKVGRAMRHLARHPRKLPGMMRLQRSTARALRHLGSTLAAVLESGWPGAR